MVVYYRAHGSAVRAGAADEAMTVEERLTEAGAEVLDTSGWNWTIQL
ncbi:hypothetical protein ACWKSP_39525 [Micromonosporaceae bacterium Da 78-11]